MRLKITAKLAILFIIAPFSGILFMSIYLHTKSKSELLENLGSKLEIIARTTALSIKEKNHRKIVSLKWKKSSSFKTIRHLLDRVKTSNSLKYDCIYTFQVINQQSLELRFAVMLHKKVFIGSQYKVPNMNRDIFLKVISGKSAYTGLYTDNHGEWISGLAPIINKKSGNVTGILEVDYKFDKYIEDLQAQFQTNMLITVFTLLLGIALSLLISSRTSSLIQGMIHASNKISQGDYDINLKRKTNDEFGDLITQFNKMAVELKERLHLLKYIPNHTINSIKKNLLESHGEKKLLTEKSDITIFVSDIRAFTPFAEKHSPTEVIETINRYLNLQTKIIKKHGGSIDKYVGDEIIAFFHHSNRDVQATLAACEIHHEIEKMNMNESIQKKKLEVGIGINSGFVVMGDLGSDEFMDYTAVGIHMNIATRMCAGAKAQEVVISHPVYERISNSDVFHTLKITSRGKVLYKGVSEPIEIYLVST